MHCSPARLEARRHDRRFPTYFATGQTQELYTAIYPFTESLVVATPYIFPGLAVAVGFRCGLFNIGAEGQFFMGALGAAFVGYSIIGLPWFIHLPLALLGGALGRGRLGGHPRLSQGKVRRPRSGQHHHDELDRVPPQRLAVERSDEMARVTARSLPKSK